MFSIFFSGPGEVRQLKARLAETEAEVLKLRQRLDTRLREEEAAAEQWQQLLSYSAERKAGDRKNGRP